MCEENLKTKTDLTLNEINILLSSEKEINIFKKLLYFKFKKMGYSKAESCELAGFPESSSYYLEDIWNKGGYYSLIPHYGGGRNSKLSDNQFKDLKTKLDGKSSWLVDDVKQLIKEEYGVEYTYQNVRNLLLKLKIPIDNYFEIERENKKNTKRIIENYDDISDETKKEINNLICKMKEEKSVYVYKKLNYLLFRTIGFSNKESSHFLNVTSATGNNWYNAWKTRGYEGLKRKKGQGRKTKSSANQMEDLKKN